MQTCTHARTHTEKETRITQIKSLLYRSNQSNQIRTGIFIDILQGEHAHPACIYILFDNL